jgi:hypothetical protein
VNRAPDKITGAWLSYDTTAHRTDGQDRQPE